MFSLNVDEHAAVQCRWCGNTLHAVRFNPTGSLPMDVVQFFMNRHSEDHPALIVEGGNWIMAETCPVEHTGEPPLLDGGPPAGAPLDRDLDSPSVDSSESDRRVLEKFFESTDGPNWKNNKDWNIERDLAKWFGVTVSQPGGRVTKLLLPNNGLSGSIPGELGRLSELNRLNLNYNQLRWGIPIELGSLSNLVSLKLRGNKLRDQIPPELGSLRQLVSLDLDGNALEGEVPEELSALRGLKSFKLAGNKITGDMPVALRNIIEENNRRSDSGAAAAGRTPRNEN